MSSKQEAAEMTFSSMQEVQDHLGKMREQGLRSPRDQWIVELAKPLFFAVPVFLMLFGIIDNIAVIAFFTGYFYLRWFNKIAKPALQRRFAPKEIIPNESPIKVKVSSEGLHVERGGVTGQFSWSRVAINKVAELGYVFRTEPEEVLVFPFEKLPPEWSGDRLIAAIDAWTTRKTI